MKEQKSKESKLFKAIDKLEAVIQHNEASIETWIPLEYELNKTYGNEDVKEIKELEELREVVRKDTIKKLLFVCRKGDCQDILIREISDIEIESSAKVIRGSFSTVARELRLTSKNCPTNPAFITSKVLRSLKDKGINMFGLFISGIQTGFVAVEKADEKTFYMEKLAVGPQYRNQGYGKMLMDFVVDYVQVHNGNILSIGIINENTVLKKWYNDYGFKETGCKKFPHLPFMVCYMEKEIIFKNGRTVL